LFEGFVGGQHDGAPLVALADDLEEQVGAVLVYRKISAAATVAALTKSLSACRIPRSARFLNGCLTQIIALP
jgi:hypothetical protein